MTSHPRPILLNLLAAVEGGQVTRARHFLERLRRYDVDSRFVILKARNALPFCVSAPGIDVREVDVGTGGLSRALRRMLWENANIPSLVRRPPGYTYLTFSHYLPSTFPRNGLSVVGVSNLAPFSEDARKAEPSVLGRAKLRLLQHTIMSSVRRATSVIALSETCKRTLQSRGISGAKIHVVPNGVSVDVPAASEYLPALQRLRLAPGYLLCVSHFHPYKNFLRLIEAYGMISPQLRAVHPLVLVGRPTDVRYFHTVSERICATGLQATIRIIPGLDHQDLRFVYSGAAALVFPSLVENSPNILLEAMAYGLPVATSRVAAMLEFGGEAPLYFDPLSSADMSKAIETLLRAPAIQDEMRNRSRVRSSIFSWDQFTDRVVSIYQCPGEPSAFGDDLPDFSLGKPQ